MFTLETKLLIVCGYDDNYYFNRNLLDHVSYVRLGASEAYVPLPAFVPTNVNVQ